MKLVAFFVESSLILLGAQGPLAQHFKRPKLRASESAGRKSLLMEKVPVEKMEALGVAHIHLKEVQSLGFLYVRGRGNGKELCL